MLDGTESHERIVVFQPAIDNMATLEQIERLVLREAERWREPENLDHYVKVTGDKGSHSCASVAQARDVVARSGIDVEFVELLVREHIGLQPPLRGVRIDGHPSGNSTAHVWGSTLSETIGLAHQIEYLASTAPDDSTRSPEGGNPPAPLAVRKNRSLVSWWRGHNLGTQITAGVIAGLIVAGVLYALTSLL